MPEETGASKLVFPGTIIIIRRLRLFLPYTSSTMWGLCSFWGTATCIHRICETPRTICKARHAAAVVVVMAEAFHRRRLAVGVIQGQLSLVYITRQWRESTLII